MERGDQGTSAADGEVTATQDQRPTHPGSPEHEPSTQSPNPRSASPTLLQTTPPSAADSLARGEAPAMEFEAWFGRTIDGRYKIVELLGEGGMGAVFVAEHLALRKQVALKIIRPEFAGVPEIAARFTREAMATAKLDHPHVASALDYGMLPDGAAYLVIQLVRGESLRSVLDQHSLPWPTACDIASQIADALAGAHAEGIIHRDLKPDNVLLQLRDDGRYLAKVVDFGIARVATDNAAPSPGDGLTRMGMVMGTPGYMSPEQALGEPVELHTDLYALGVVLWECIAGRPLFTAESLTELIARQLAEAPTPLGSITGQPLPEQIDELIAQLLSRTPTARPGSAAEVRDLLRKLAAAGAATEGDLTTLPGGAFASPRQTERAPTVAGFPRPPGPLARLASTLRQRWADDRRSMLVLGAAVMMLFVIGVVSLASGDGDGDGDGDGTEAQAASAAVAAASPAEVDPEDPAADKAKKTAGASKRDAADEADSNGGSETGDSDGSGDDDGGQSILAAASELKTSITTLLNSDDAKARKEAATLLLELPEVEHTKVVRALAQLELAKSCRDVKKRVIEVTELGDPQVRPALERISARSRKGCSPFRQGDCWKCLRKTVKSSLAKLAEVEAAAEAAEAGGGDGTPAKGDGE